MPETWPDLNLPYQTRAKSPDKENAKDNKLPRVFTDRHGFTWQITETNAWLPARLSQIGRSARCRYPYMDMSNPPSSAPSYGRPIPKRRTRTKPRVITTGQQPQPTTTSPRSQLHYNHRTASAPSHTLGRPNPDPKPPDPEEDPSPRRDYASVQTESCVPRNTPEYPVESESPTKPIPRPKRQPTMGSPVPTNNKLLPVPVTRKGSDKNNPLAGATDTGNLACKTRGASVESALSKTSDGTSKGSFVSQAGRGAQTAKVRHKDSDVPIIPEAGDTQISQSRSKAAGTHKEKAEKVVWSLKKIF